MSVSNASEDDRPTSLSLLGAAIGRAVAPMQDLRGVFLPSGLSQHVADSVVWRALQMINASAGAGSDGHEPVVLRYWDEDAQGTPPESSLGIDYYDRDSVIQRRLDRRLIVADTGSVSTLETLKSSFQVLMGEDYPAGVPIEGLANGGVDLSLEGLAEKIAEELLGAFGLDVDDVAQPTHHRLAGAVKYCISYLRQAYEWDRGDGSGRWHVGWFEHVDAALSSLVTYVSGRSELDLTDPRGLVFAAMALPQPDGSTGSDPSWEYRTANEMGRVFAERVREGWNSEEDVRLSLARIDLAGLEPNIGDLGWDGLDLRRSVDHLSVWLFAGQSRDHSDYLDVLGSLTETQFFGSGKATAPILEFAATEGDDRGASLRGHLVNQSVGTIELGHFPPDGLCASLWIGVGVVAVGVAATELAERCAETTLQFVIGGKNGSFSLDRDGAPEVAEEGTGEDARIVIWFKVELCHRKAVVGAEVNWPEKSQPVRIVIPDGDPLSYLVERETSGALIVVPPDVPYLIAEHFRSNGKGTPSAPRLLFPSPIRLAKGKLTAPNEAVAVIVESGTDFATSVVCIGEEPSGAGVPKGGQRLLTSQDEGGVVQVRGGTFEVESSGAGAKKQRSPLVAAAMDISVVSTALPEQDLQSLRGCVERSYLKQLATEYEDLRHSLGHVVLPDFDHDAAVDDLVAMPGTPWLMPRALSERWDEVMVAAVPTQLLESDAADEFRKAFDRLDLHGLLEPSAGDVSSAGASRLISQMPFGELLKRELVESYVEAYLALIAVAKDLALKGVANHQMGIFWASYPFSVSVWEKSAGFLESRAILLSPLHPVRLLWLHSAETVLRDADGQLKRGLAGVVEGWSLPAVGPTEGGDRMVAIAADAGPGQVFLGWGLLGRARVGGASPVKLPEFAGNRRMPGSSTGGLNADGVSKAIHDYRHTFPHVTTLTVDLAARNETSRLASIDEAVIKGVLGAGEKGASLVGGLRVFDSVNRRGSIPELAEYQGADRGSAPTVPLVWRRYDPEVVQAPPNADIRVLQDSGSAVLVAGLGAGTDGNAGVLAAAGVRRLEARAGISPGMGGEGSRPGLGDEDDSLLARSLNAIETDEREHAFKVTSSLGPGFFDGGPRWTVAGESTLHPSLVAGLLDAKSTDLTLWEWRPPFLSSSQSSEPQLDRRPYLALTRVSQTLKDQIAYQLQAVDNYPMEEAGPGQLVRVLGQHGVGLSRMFVRKDTHVIGAIGFAMTLGLIAQSSPSGDHWDFVFPIDMCESYLCAMANPDLDWRRRADLLLLRLHQDGQLDLAPIEVKVRNLAEPQATFPPTLDQTLRDAAAQVDETARLLDSIVENVENARSGSDSAASANLVLLSAALGALLDAAISLSSGSLGDYASLRRAVFMAVRGLDGEEAADHRLRVRRPMVVYLTNGAHEDGGESVLLRRDVRHAPIEVRTPEEGVVADPALHCQLLLNIGDLATALWGGGDAGAFTSQWGDAVEWMLANEDHLNGDDNPLPEVLEPPTPSPEPDSTKPAPIRGAIAEQRGTVATDGDGSSAERGDGSITEPSAKSGRHDIVTSQGGVITPDPESASEGSIVDGGIRFPVGHFLSTKGPISAEFWPANTALNQMNVGVVGDLGTGKTELIKALIWQIRRLGPERQGSPVSFLVLDYKGDYRGEEFLSEVGGTATGGEPIPLDVLQLSEPYSQQAAYRKAAMFTDVIKRIYGGVGPVQTSHLNNSIVQLFAETNGVAPTLHEVYERYLQNAGRPDAVSGVLENFTQGGWFESDRSKMKTFGELLGDGVLVVSLDHPDLGGSTKNAIVALMLNLYRSHMLSQTIWPFEGASPQLRKINSFLLIDEAHNIMPYGFAALESVLLQGRQFGVGTILSSQFLSHFKTHDNDYRQPLLTWFIHKVPQLTVGELAQLGNADVNQSTVDEVKDLEVSHSYFRSLGSNGRTIRDIPYWQLMQSPD